MTEGYTEWEENYFRMLTLSEERLQGKLEGEKNKSILIAKNLKKSGLDIKFISENTGLSIEEVEKL